MWSNIGNKIPNNFPLGLHMNQIQLYCKTEICPLIYHIIPEYLRIPSMRHISTKPKRSSLHLFGWQLEPSMITVLIHPNDTDRVWNVAWKLHAM